MKLENIPKSRWMRGGQGKFLFLLLPALIMVGACSGTTKVGSILVPPFENATGNSQLDPWQPWLADMMIRTLWQQEDTVVLSPQRVADFQATLAPQAAGAVYRQAAHAAGFGSLLQGRLAADPAGFLLSASLLDLDTGRERAAVQARVSRPSDLPQGIDRLRDALWHELGIARPADVRPVASMTTEKMQAYGDFMAGEALYHQQKFLAASGAFSEALKKDVDFSLAAYRKVTALMQYVVLPSPELKSLMTQAWARRMDVGERDRLVIEALRRLLYQEPGKAADLYEEVCRRWPGDKELDFFHAVALTRSHREAEAVDAFRTAVKEDAQFIPALEGLATTAFVLNKREEAMHSIGQALRVNPADPGLQQAAVTYDLFAGHLEAARKRLDEALHFRSDPSLLLERGNLLLLEGKIQAAMDLFIQIRSPFSVATTEVYQGRINAALARLGPMIDTQLSQGNREASAVGLWYAGMLFQAQENLEMAEKQYTRSINFAVDFVDCLEAMGTLRVRQGKLREARAILDSLRKAKGSELGWERHPLRLQGLIEMAEGKETEALEHLRQAQQLSRTRFMAGGYISDSPLYTFSLGKALLQHGDVEGARREFQAITQMAADRLYWPWIWMAAHTQLAELAARENLTAQVQEHVALVRQYWGPSAGQHQPLVDGLLERVNRLVPAGNNHQTAPPPLGTPGR